MKLKYLLAASIAGLSANAILPQAASAQQITSGVEGRVLSADGTEIAGAVVTVTDTRTNASRTITTGSNGSFRTVGLVAGGPYTITAEAPGFEGQTVENQFLTVSGNTSFSFELGTAAAGAVVDTIVVTASRAGATQLAVGPGSAFGEATLENFPSITRDVRDIIRLDPRVSLERDNEVDRISCLGGNDRSNTFTVDGIVQADVFGLNGTPFAARNSLPLPFDVIRETSVEFAPFDVEYSDFTGCLVNVVTKSGTNRFEGSAFYTYFGEDLFADEIDGRPLNAGSEERWGATLGGPIVPDRLFFFAGYEETDLGDGNDFGPAGGGFTNEANFVTQGQFDRFAQIAQSVYGQDIGGFPTQLPESAVRYFGRLDAYIADGQRLEGTYQRLEETNVETDFGGQQLGGLNSFEDEGTVSDYYSVRLFSDWSDTISTELRLSRAEVADVQGPVGFGEAQSDNPTVRLAVLVDGPPGGQSGLLTTGPGIFRSANALETTVNQGRFITNINADEHSFKIGAEINDLEVFNLFAINATGTIFFQSLEDFAEGLVAPGSFASVFSGAGDFVRESNDPSRGRGLGGAVISVTPSGDINEAAATFRRQIFSVFAQDEWQATDRLSLTAGLRVQWFDGDAPRANPLFRERFGFTNANPFSKIDPIFLPRAAASYEFENEGFFSNTRLVAGVGMFSGGDPVVFFSNAFSNNGFSTAEGSTFDCDDGELPIDPATGQIDVVRGGDFTGIPACAIAAGSADAAAGRADTQSTDPDFDAPTVLRLNAGIETAFGAPTGLFSDIRLNIDYIYSRFIDPLNFVDLVQTPDIRRGLNGFTVDGRPIYAAIDPVAAGCGAELQGTGGTPPVYNNVTPACFNTRIDDFIQLTNGDPYESHVASVLLSKDLGNGLFTETGNLSFSLGYSFVDSENFRNVGSSTATSNYDITAAFDRQDPAVSTSNFETRHNFVASVFLREDFFEDYSTGLGIFFRATEGRPYSLTFDGGGVFNDSSSGNDNALLYVPSGIDDPNVAPPTFNAAGERTGGSDPAAVAALVDYLNTSDVAEQCDFTPGQSIERNTCRNDWFYDLDLRISQEIPFIGRLTGIVDDRIELFADFDNFLNLIDSSANIFRTRDQFVDLVDAGVDSQGRYVITDFNPDDQEFIGISSSAWRIQVGARYEF